MCEKPLSERISVQNHCLPMSRVECYEGDRDGDLYSDPLDEPPLPSDG